jgi:hypothetical protein
MLQNNEMKIENNEMHVFDREAGLAGEACQRHQTLP